MFICKWIIIVTLMLLHRSSFSLAKFVTLNNEPLNEIESERLISSPTTTICVQIQPTIPEEEPYYMCKGAEFPFIEKYPKTFDFSEKSVSTKKAENEYNNPFSSANGEKYQSSTDGTTFTNGSPSNIQYNNPETKEQTYPESAKNYFQNSPGNSYKSIPANPSYSAGNAFYAPEDKGQITPSSLSYQNQQSSYDLPYSKLSGQIFQKTSNSPTDRSRPETIGSNGAQEARQFGDNNKSRISAVPLPTASSSYDPSSRVNGITPQYNDRPHPSSNAKPINADAGPYINEFNRPEFAKFEYHPENPRSSQSSERLIHGENLKSIPEVTRQYAYQPSYIPTDGNAGSSPITPSQIFPTTPAKTSSSSYAYPTIKIQTTSAPANGFINPPTLQSPNPISSKFFDTLSQNKYNGPLDEDVLGVPNWNFSPDEFNMVGGSEDPIILTTQGNPIYPQPRTAIPLEYSNDPVMRTFYESFQDYPTFSSYPPPTTEYRAHLLGETNPNEAKNLYSPATSAKADSCVNKGPIEGPTYSSGSSYASYPNSMDVTAPNIYQPVVITLPCCNSQKPLSDPPSSYPNLGSPNPYQPQDPFVGNSFSTFFGFQRPTPLQNFLSFFNGNLHNLLGTPNPMLNPVGIPNPSQSIPILSGYPNSNLNHFFPTQTPLMGLSNPMLSLSTPYMNWQAPFNLAEPTSPANLPTSPQPYINQNMQSTTKMPEDQMVSLPNPLKILTKLPDIVKTVNKNIEEATKQTAELLQDSLEEDDELEDDDDDLLIRKSTTPLLGLIRESEEQNRSHDLNTSESSLVSKEAEERVSSSDPKQTSEVASIKSDHVTSTTAITTESTNSELEDASKRYNEYTQKARAKALNSKEAWNKRSRTYSSSEKNPTTERIERQTSTSGIVYKRKYTQSL